MVRFVVETFFINFNTQLCSSIGDVDVHVILELFKRKCEIIVHTDLSFYIKLMRSTAECLLKRVKDELHIKYESWTCFPRRAYKDVMS